jgi:cation transport regulator ChaC
MPTPPDDRPTQYVFGYGSLSAWAAPGLSVATLADCLRVWDVAMDNAETISGYKYYVDPESGARPALHVSFLNLAEAPGTDCVGFLVPVGDAASLAALDRRERNYDRVEVTGRIRTQPALALAARVWAYHGTVTARERYARAARAGTAVVQHAYKAAVEQAFDARGMGEAYRASTRAPECPVRELRRVNVPQAASAPGPGAP